MNTKITTLLAMTGGISALTRRGLQKDGTCVLSDVLGRETHPN